MQILIPPAILNTHMAKLQLQLSTLFLLLPQLGGADFLARFGREFLSGHDFCQFVHSLKEREQMMVNTFLRTLPPSQKARTNKSLDGELRGHYRPPVLSSFSLAQ